MLATDWTYDLFYEDSKLYEATPRKGVYCRKNASDREQFMVWFKNCVRDFKEEWSLTCPHYYDRTYGWIGDRSMDRLSEMNFSDYYKDTYGQRPHLSGWYYVHVVGLPTTEDTARTFCANPIEDAVNRAKEMRVVIGIL